MAVAPKKSKNRKAFRNVPYEPQGLERTGNKSTLEYNAALKKSPFTNHDNIKQGKNPVFTFPVPMGDPLKGSLLNDEVDMHFPRKHFLNKFQLYNDLLENVISKPIPVDKIIPPNLFPIPYVEGIPYKNKRTELLKDVNDYNLSQEQIVSNKEIISNDEASSNKVTSVEKENPKKEDNLDGHKNTTKKETIPEGTATNEDASREIAENENLDKGNNESSLKLEKEKNGTSIDNKPSVSDDNLSDYDPDFIDYQIPYPKESEHVGNILDDYLNMRLKCRPATDFFFGDSRLMKLQERCFSEQVHLESEALKRKLYVSEKYKYKLESMKSMHEEYRTFTANSLKSIEEKLELIEAELKSKFNVTFADAKLPVEFHNLNVEMNKQEISVEDYNFKYKSERQPFNPTSGIVSTNDISEEKKEGDSEDQHREIVDDTNIDQNFDFDMYESGAYANDGGNAEDGEFASLSNDVFLNI